MKFRIRDSVTVMPILAALTGAVTLTTPQDPGPVGPPPSKQSNTISAAELTVSAPEPAPVGPKPR